MTGRKRKLSGLQEWAIGEAYRVGISPDIVTPDNWATIYDCSVRTVHNARDRAVSRRPAEVA